MGSSQKSVTISVERKSGTSARHSLESKIAVSRDNRFRIVKWSYTRGRFKKNKKTVESNASTSRGSKNFLVARLCSGDALCHIHGLLTSYFQSFRQPLGSKFKTSMLW